MGRILSTLIFAMVASLCLSMEVSVSTCSFSSDKGAYIEIYSKFKARSLQWSSPQDDLLKLYSEIEMICIIEQGDSIIVADRYRIMSPEGSSPSDYWDMKRYGLDTGEYFLTMQYVDLNNLNDTLEYRTNIEIDFAADEVLFSDILLIEEVASQDSSFAFSKNNFSFEPLEFNLLNASDHNLIFYTELYNADQLGDEAVVLKYYLENADVKGLDRYTKTGYKKVVPSSSYPVLLDFSVKELISGNYILHLELNDRSKRMICEKQSAISVYNPYEDYKNELNLGENYESSFVQFFTEDELNYSLKAIFPRVGNNMTELLNAIIRNKELEPKRYFLYSFWSAVSIQDMKSHYEAYMDVAKAVDNSYATNVFHGFETDRGRIFLKYGKPDDLVFEEDEQTAPPYEIWIYNHIPETQQTNVKFLFYNPTLVTNDFVLLHSNCRGERNNPRWEMDLYSDAVNELPGNYIDNREMPDNFNRNARRYFNDF